MCRAGVSGWYCSVIVCVWWQVTQLEHKCAVLESVKSTNVSRSFHTFNISFVLKYLIENVLSTQECKLCVVCSFAVIEKNGLVCVLGCRPEAANCYWWKESTRVWVETCQTRTFRMPSGKCVVRVCVVLNFYFYYFYLLISILQLWPSCRFVQINSLPCSI